MKFHCEKCQTKYSIADAKVHRRVLRIRCKHCANIIVVRGEAELDEIAAKESRNEAHRGTAVAAGAASQAQSGPRRRPTPPDSAPSLRALSSDDGPRDDSGIDGADENEDIPTLLSPILDPSAGEGEEWYLAVEGHQFGPMSLDELCKRVKRGEARSESGEEGFIWREGFDDWIEATAVPELHAYLPPPPLPRARSASTPYSDGLDRGGVSRSSNLSMTGPPDRKGRAASSAESALRTAAAASVPVGEGGAVAQVGNEAAIAPQPLEAGEAAVSETAAPLAAGGLPVALPASTVPGAVVPAEKSPFATKIVAVSAATIAIALVFIAGYLLLSGKRGGEVLVAKGHLSEATVVDTPSALDEKVDSEDPTEVEDRAETDLEDFTPMEVGRSAKRRRRSASAKVRAKERAPSTREALTSAASDPETKGGDAEKRRLLALYGSGKKADSALPTGKKPRRRQASSRTITGSEIQRLQVTHRRAIQACYDRALKRDFSLKDVRADITLLVGTSGKVKRVSFAGVSNADLVSCLKRTLSRWLFRPIGGTRSVEINFPFFFRGS